MKMPVLTILIIFFTFACSFAQHIPQPAYLTASWYDRASLIREGTWKNSKGRMSNGKLFNENSFTAASCDFPLKTKLRITNIKDPKKNVVVEITDKTNKRFKGKRVDLSRAAFLVIADLRDGLCRIKVEVL